MDMNDLMQQAQRMQLELAKAQEEVKQLSYTSTAGGGMVKATATGDGLISELVINPEAVDPDDVELLQDMVVSAVNGALRGIAEESESRMSAATGFNMPDLSNLSGLF